MQAPAVPPTQLVPGMLSDDARDALRHYADPQPHTVPRDPRIVNMLIREGYIDCQGGLMEYGRQAVVNIGSQ